MLDRLLGETWESFFIEGYQVGFIRRLIAKTTTPKILLCKTDVIFGEAKFSHDYYFYDEPGYPSHSYLYDSNDGAPVHGRFVDDKLICQVDDHTFSEGVPAGSRPSYGNYPLVVTIPFEEGFKLSCTQIEDSSCTILGTTDLISHGWESVKVSGQNLNLWRVSENANGQLGNRYWLDSERRIRLSDWKGAESVWVANKEEAIRNLPAELLTCANSLENRDSKPDWVTDVETWLNQNQ